jgi:hypothetical protein
VYEEDSVSVIGFIHCFRQLRYITGTRRAEGADEESGG